MKPARRTRKAERPRSSGRRSPAALAWTAEPKSEEKQTTSTPEATIDGSRPTPEREAHRVFVEEYMANGGNATRAYLAAYPRCRSEKAAASNGLKLLRKTEIRDAITARQQADPRIATREEIQRYWSEQLHCEEIDRAQRNRASDLLARSYGMFVEHVEARSDVHYMISWDTDHEQPPNASPQPARRRPRR
jgi:hypothetical protein